MRATDIMTSTVFTVRESTSLADAIRLMTAHRVSGLPVVDDADNLIGIITQRDLLLKHELINEVGDVMVRSVLSVDEDAGYMDIVEVLLQHSITRVPVVRNGRVVGIVSRGDLIRRRLAEIEDASTPRSL